MPDPQERPETIGTFLRSEDPPAFGTTEVVAALLAAIWVVAVVTYAVLAPEGERGWSGTILMLLALFLPLALLWGAVSMLRSIRVLRAEAARLQSTVDAMRNAYLVSQQSSAAIKPVVEQRLEEVAQVTKEAAGVLATFQTRRDPSLTVPSADRKAALVPPQRPAVQDEQPALALGTPAEDLRAPLSVGDFIRALNFPESAEDREGFRALRLALEDRTVAKLIRAAQDVLTLLSQEGIYMDDLRPERVRPELWRRFAAGERGRAIAGLGGIRDRSSLALTASRMREDPIFRDAGHHFLRTFDKTFQEFEMNASDADLAELSDTRTARAFMLFGRVTGTFD